MDSAVRACFAEFVKDSKCSGTICVFSSYGTMCSSCVLKSRFEISGDEVQK